MALNIAINGAYTRNHFSLHHNQQPLYSKTPSLSSLTRKTTPSHITTNAKKLSSRTGRFDSKNKKADSGISTTTRQEEEVLNFEDIDDEVDDGYFLPELPGDKPDPFEGSQWDALGFLFSICGLSLIGCGIAVATYNEGATDFKQTPAFKESIQSRELLEEPEASDADVFEANPTEDAPSLD
ncbi:hypothetical protein IFM89_020468 [Coptis chinensis]|uniref:Uncharacterized protein n=1 Tax=Coptis chinensis TaxID=261450 RepID=A0A835H7K2_9MAGN|nr:hypothetical protein IFM89_020468 [Coptis chinensis]